jgi:hypothetical protein
VVRRCTAPTEKMRQMNNALVRRVVAKPRMPKHPSAFVVNTTTYRATKTQTLLLRAHDKRDEAAAAKKLRAAEAKQAKADKALGK